MSILSSIGSALGQGALTAIGGLPGSLLGGLIGLGQSQISYRDAMKLQLQNFEQSKLLSQFQFDLQKQQFDYTNMYNSPKEAAERLKLAGFNPNLTIGQVGTASMPSVSAPHMTQMNPAALMQTQLDFAKQLRENALLSEQQRSLKLENDYKEQSLADRLYYQRALSVRMDRLAEIATNEKYISDFKLVMQNDIHNINQLLLHGKNGNFKFAGENASIKDSDLYLVNLSQSELYRSIKAVLVKEDLSASSMVKKLDILEQQFLAWIEDVRFKRAHADVEEFYARLADAGMNPHDPLWARVIVSLLEQLGVNVSSVVEAVKHPINALKDALSD